MEPTDDNTETSAFRAGKFEAPSTHNIDTLKHIEKKLVDRGVHRKDRHPADGLHRGRQPKSGHGGKFTWEGSAGDVANETEPAALDEKDPNYVDEEEEEDRVVQVSDVDRMLVGEIDVPKLAEEGVGRIVVDPKLQANV